MNTRRILIVGLAAAALLAANSIARADHSGPREAKPGSTLISDVRRVVAPYQDVKAAEAAGYALFHGCVNGPQGGAMGVHFVNGDLVGDAKVEASKPEALMYEMKNGKMQLVGVEYVTIAEGWDAANKMPPMLKGQLFTYNTSPNRYGIPAFYALHVWTKPNPNGAFADWNPRVSCDEYVGEDSTHAGAAHGSGH